MKKIVFLDQDDLNTLECLKGEGKEKLLAKIDRAYAYHDSDIAGVLPFIYERNEPTFFGNVQITNSKDVEKAIRTEVAEIGITNNGMIIVEDM